MKNYKVSYAGLPGGEAKISAQSAKLAALQFFVEAPCRNSIIVGTGWLSEMCFSCEEIIKDIPEVRIEDIPLKIRKEDPPKKIGLIQEFMNHVILGEFHSWK
ncbi:hypothetical protein [Pelagicoccus sp. SDUM812003]|uniref:hypothetical protein n=1 Tax=Pelagicoccus sp. SDUM812003 TaxID=3041267 RepID=UPI00280FC1F4|nr:hypothetical protein [Pelagicoccus sp. SDUM812003]MDQ8205843.1 hypothetical protein [Pelagicoccus sp. SDUM812003]